MKITPCGSIAFYKEMESVRDQLLKLGHVVKIPELALEVPQEFGSGKKVYFGKYIEKNILKKKEAWTRFLSGIRYGISKKELLETITRKLTGLMPFWSSITKSVGLKVISAVIHLLKSVFPFI